MGLVDTSGRGCEVEGADGVGGGDMKATFFCISGLAADSGALRAAGLDGGGSKESVKWGTGEDTGRPTPLSLSASVGSSMGGRGRAERSGKGFVEAREEGVPVLVAVVLALADL